MKLAAAFPKGVINAPNIRGLKMEADHPKLQAFQEALNKALTKRLEASERKLLALRQEKEAKAKLKQAKTVELYEAQKHLKKDEAKLLAITRDLEEVAQSRHKIDEENVELETSVNSKLIQLRDLQLKKDWLREEYNRVLHLQIVSEAKRVNLAGDVNASHTVATKTEEDFKRLQEQKKLQDLYLNNLQQKLEDMGRQSMEYREQTISIQKQTQELRETLRKAEDEVTNVKWEKGTILQKWTTSVLYVSKQDEAIQTFRSGLLNQELELKKIKFQLEGTKREIVEHQEKHEHLTSIENRLEKMSSTRKAQIKRTGDMINDANTDLTTAQKAKASTLATLATTDEEVRQVEIQIQNLRRVVEALDKEKIDLEDQIFLLCRDQSCAEKTSKYADRIIRTLRSERSDLEAKLADFQHNLSVTMAKISEKQSLIGSTIEEQVKLRVQNESLNKDLDHLEQKLARTQAIIDKRQSVIDFKEKLKSELSEAKAGEALSPLESEMRRVQREIEDVTEFCNQAKVQWIKYQQQFIEKTKEKGGLNEKLNESTRRYLIMQEKKRKLEKEMSIMEQSVEHIQRRLENKDGYLSRLNTQVQGDQIRYEEGVKLIEGKTIGDLEALENVQRAVDDLQKWITELDTSIETEKLNAVQAEAQMVEWEERLKSCKETHELISSQRGRDGELEGLKSEVHRLQVRLEQVERQSKTLMDKCQESVQRRETLVDKAATNSLLHQSKKPQMNKSMVNKKIEDLKTKLKKLQREEQSLKHLCEDKRSRHSNLETEVEARRERLKQIRSNSDEIAQEIEAHHDLKDVKLAHILQLQTRSKWYRSVKERKYKMYSKSEGKFEDEIQGIKEQNDRLREGLEELESEFPYLKANLKRLRHMMV